MHMVGRFNAPAAPEPLIVARSTKANIMQNNKMRNVLAVAVIPCITGGLLMSSLPRDGISLFGAGNDFSLGLLQGFVAGVAIGIALLLTRKCRVTHQ